MSPDILQEARDVATSSERGLGGAALLLARKAIPVLHRVVSRLRDGTHHGVHCTISEELLREFYVGAAGSFIWEGMKGDIHKAFASNEGLTGEALHGGTYFLERLRDYLNDDSNPPLKVSLVGHSAGGIYISELLAKAGEVLPEGFKFNQVIMLAPGVDFELFKKGVVDHADRIRSFRMFTMRDELEQKDILIRFEAPVPGEPGKTKLVELGAIYPRSLLYLVSGLLEGDREKPILGMERFFLDSSPHRDQSVEAVKGYLGGTGRVVWSVVEEGDAGLICGARSHGGFGNEALTLRSIIHLMGI
jgi:hypothetical protein